MAINKKTLHIQEFDLLRGLAAIFMIINHIGFALWAKHLTKGDLASMLLLITSYAPVLFFFTSGLGAGIQSHAKHKSFNLASTLYKFTLLIVADLFFAFGKGELLGFDFLGFIAVIVLLLEPIKYSNYARWICVIGIGIAFILRFIIAPELHLENTSIVNILINWTLGHKVDGSSYPLSPWITYPLLGFLIGSGIAKAIDPIKFMHQKPTQFMLLFIGLVFSTGSAFLYSRGVSFFRWGTVGFGFYALSFGVIALSMILVLLGNRIKGRLSLFYIGGAASLAIVPVHYFIIFVLKEMGLKSLGTLSFSITAITALIISFVAVKHIDRAFRQLQPHLSNKKSIILIMLVILGLAISAFNYSSSMPLVSKTSQLLGQLLICLLFVLRIKKASK